MNTRHCCIILGIVALLAIVTRAAEPPVGIPVERQDPQEFYRPGFQISLFGGLITPDLDDERSNVGFGADFFFTKNLGIGALTSFEDLNGAAFDNVAVRGIFRAPIQQYAFYAYAGVTREFDVNEWSLQIGPGFEWRFTPRIGSFAEIGLTKQWTGDREVAAEARIGLRYGF